MNFEELPYFTKKIAKLRLAAKLEHLKAELVSNPQKGDIIQGAAGARKISWGTQDQDGS